MSYSLAFHFLVEQDIDNAYNWYEDIKVGLGEEFLGELRHSYKKLQDHPHSFSKTTKKFRKVILSRFPYIITFIIVEQRVLVYAVFHTSRNPREILKRK